MKKEIITMLFVAIMALTLLPITVFSSSDKPNCTGDQIDCTGSYIYYDRYGGTCDVDESNFAVSTGMMIAPLENENEFEIAMIVRTTSDIAKIDLSKDAAIVFVIDISATMDKMVSETKTRLDATKEAIIDFLDEFCCNAGNSRRMVSIVTFGGLSAHNADACKGYSQVELGWTDISESEKLSGAKAIVGGLTADSGAFTQGGLMLARNLFLPENAPEDANGNVISNRFVVMISSEKPIYTKETVVITGDDRTVEPDILTIDISTTSLNPIVENLLYDVESESPDNTSDVPAVGSIAIQLATQVASQIRYGNFNNNYSARLYTIGFDLPEIGHANSLGGGGSFTGDEWLQKNIASAATVDKISKYRHAFRDVSETIIRTINPWIIKAPMARYIKYDLENSVNNTNNSASVNDDTLTWNIKDSIPVSIVQAGSAAIYTYELKYKVVLDNLTGYEAQNTEKEQEIQLREENCPGIINTNRKTTLIYVTADNKADGYKEEDYVTAEFIVPEIHGYDASLSFSKTDQYNHVLSQPFEFTLSHAPDCPCKSSAEYSQTVINKIGIINFSDIPSGHNYLLSESHNPVTALYKTNEEKIPVTVSYGDITCEIKDGNFINNARVIPAYIEPTTPEFTILTTTNAGYNGTFIFDYSYDGAIWGVGFDDLVSGRGSITLDTATDGFRKEVDLENLTNFCGFITVTERDGTAGSSWSYDTSVYQLVYKNGIFDRKYANEMVEELLEDVVSFTNTYTPLALITPTDYASDETPISDPTENTDIPYSDLLNSEETSDEITGTEEIEAYVKKPHRTIMPKTGLGNALQIWLYGLCFSMIGLTAIPGHIRRIKRENKE